MDKELSVDSDGLQQAVDLMSRDFSNAEGLALPIELPQVGMGSKAALTSLAPSVLGGAARLGEATSFAHMDPPTPPAMASLQASGRPTVPSGKR